MVNEYERAVIFRMGRLLGRGEVGPGLHIQLPCLDSHYTVDMRTITFDVPSQEVWESDALFRDRNASSQILTLDSVTVNVDAALYYKVVNATASVVSVEDAHYSTCLIAQTTLKNVVGEMFPISNHSYWLSYAGTRSLAAILSDRLEIAQAMHKIIDSATIAWGIAVERIEMWVVFAKRNDTKWHCRKDVRLPKLLQRAMAAEAEALRVANARQINAEGGCRGKFCLLHSLLQESFSPHMHSEPPHMNSGAALALCICAICKLCTKLLTEEILPLFSRFRWGNRKVYVHFHPFQMRTIQHIARLTSGRHYGIEECSEWKRFELFSGKHCCEWSRTLGLCKLRDVYVSNGFTRIIRFSHCILCADLSVFKVGPYQSATEWRSLTETDYA